MPGHGLHSWHGWYMRSFKTQSTMFRGASPKCTVFSQRLFLSFWKQVTFPRFPNRWLFSAYFPFAGEVTRETSLRFRVFPGSKTSAQMTRSFWRHTLDPCGSAFRPKLGIGPVAGHIGGIDEACRKPQTGEPSYSRIYRSLSSSPNSVCSFSNLALRSNHKKQPDNQATNPTQQTQKHNK